MTEPVSPDNTDTAIAMTVVVVVPANAPATVPTSAPVTQSVSPDPDVPISLSDVRAPLIDAADAADDDSGSDDRDPGGAGPSGAVAAIASVPLNGSELDVLERKIAVLVNTIRANCNALDEMRQRRIELNDVVEGRVDNGRTRACIVCIVVICTCVFFLPIVANALNWF